MITSEWPGKSSPNDVPFLGEFFKHINSIGVTTEIYKISNRSFLNWVKDLLRIKKILSDTNFDIIHTHWGYNFIYSFCFSYPQVITFHGSDLNIPKTWTVRNIIIHLLSRLATIFSNYNIFVSEELSKFNKNKPLKSSVVPMGVNLEKFFPDDKIECRKKLKLPLDKNLILFGGNTTQPVKRYCLAKEAFKNLDDNYQLIYLNYNSYEFMPLYINASDMLLMTSSSEGSPMMIKEAIACDIPVVSTNVGDVRKIISGLNNCYILSENPSPLAIAKTIKECVKNSLTPGGIEIIKKEYSLNSTASSIINIYSSLINKKNGFNNFTSKK